MGEVVEYSKVLVLDSAFSDPDGTGILSVRLSRPLPRVTGIELLEVTAPKVDDDRFLCVGCRLNGSRDINTTVLPCRETAREPNIPLMAVIPSGHVASSQRASGTSVTNVTQGLFVIDELLVVNQIRWSEPGFFSAAFPDAAIRSLGAIEVRLFKSPDAHGVIRPFKSRVTSVSLDISSSAWRPADYAVSEDATRYPRVEIEYCTQQRRDGGTTYVWDAMTSGWVPTDDRDVGYEYEDLGDVSDPTTPSDPTSLVRAEAYVVDADRSTGMLLAGALLPDPASFPPRTIVRAVGADWKRSYVSAARLYDTHVTVILRVRGQGSIGDGF